MYNWVKGSNEENCRRTSVKKLRNLFVILIVIVQIQISTADITNFEGDIIVVPCDCELTYKKVPLIQSILDKSGPNLIKELSAIDYCQIGSAVIVKGYELMAKNLIFMPIYDHTEGAGTNYLGLHQSLRNAFILAELHEAKSIAFASIRLPRKKKDFFKSLLNKVIKDETDEEPMDSSGAEDIIVSISKDFGKSSIRKVFIYKYSK